MMEIPEELREQLKGWKTGLLVSATHQPKPLFTNALYALRGAPEWEGVLAYDDFALTVMAVQPPPWRRGDNDWTSCHWTDRDDALATDWLQRQGIGVSVAVAANAVETVARDASFHPVRDYLNSLKWDGTKRLETFAAHYLGAEDTNYHTAVGRCMFVAAVARVTVPGCKVDHVPILEAEQGALKSSTVDALFSPWFSDDLAELGTKDAAMQVRVAWGIEIAELASMRKGEIERVKAFIARRVDRFRPSYGRRVVEVPRQSVFVGTTNADTYLKDETGARRFWPLRCGRIGLAAVRRDRNQLWAEAVSLYRTGTPWWLTNGHDIAAAREEQADRYIEDPWEWPILSFVEDKDDTSVSEILEHLVGPEKREWTQARQNNVSRCLVANGWRMYWARKPKRGRRYRRQLGDTMHTVDTVDTVDAGPVEN